MNHRRMILFSLMIALFLTPALLSAQTDSATLTLTGEVPAIVRIGFGGVTSDGTLALGNLNSAAPNGVTGSDTSVVYVANVNFTISVASANGGVLARDGGTVSGFSNQVGYALTWDNSAVTLPTDGSPVEIVSNGTPGAYTSSEIDIAVDPLNINSFDETSTLSSVEAAGNYQDTLTFTITASN